MKKSEEVTIKKNNKIDLLKIIKSEVNLLELPFFELFTKGLRKKTEIEYRAIKNRGNQIKEILWSVSANSKYGYPGPFDREVHKAIEQIISEILREKGKIKNPIPFSLYNLCKRMGIKGGGNYQETKKALERIQATVIKSENAFYHKGKKKWISSVFCLYDSVIFRGEQLEDGSITEINLLFLSDIYLQSLNSHNIKSINYTYWRSLKSKIASRLYEILGIKFYGVRNKKDFSICYKYTTLCQLLPVISYRYFSDAKRQLNSGNDELIDTGFISKYKWSKNGNNDWLIRYWPGERAKKEMKNGQKKQLEFKEDDYLIDSDNNGADINIKKQPESEESEHDIELINQLVDLNVSKITAKNLVKKYNNESIKDWVRAIDFTNAENKAAYIVKAIKEGWQLPEEYLREKENNTAEEEQQKINSLQKKEQEKKQKILQEEKQKLDQIYHSLDPDKQKEIDREAENSLDDFWKSQLNKERSKGKISKILKATLEEKKREAIKEWVESRKIYDIKNKI